MKTLNANMAATLIKEFGIESVNIDGAFDDAGEKEILMSIEQSDVFAMVEHMGRVWLHLFNQGELSLDEQDSRCIIKLDKLALSQ